MSKSKQASIPTQPQDPEPQPKPNPPFALDVVAAPRLPISVEPLKATAGKMERPAPNSDLHHPAPPR